MSEAIDADHIRCPLDMRRMGVTSVQWQPFLLSPKETGRQDDLVCLLKLMSELQQRTERVFPFVVDEQIHYRIMKLLYSTSYIAHGRLTPGSLGRLPSMGCGILTSTH